MCLDNNTIELQAKSIFKEIQEKTIYKPIKLLVNGGEFIHLQNNNDMEGLSSSALIKKVFLSDSEGRLYSIEPNLNGLRFATGELNYREYLWKCKQDMVYGIVIFLVSIGVFISLGWFLVKYLS